MPVGDRIRMRVEEIRTRGLVPTLRTRVEETVTQVRERIGAGGAGGMLTRETGGMTGGSTSKKKLRGL